MGTIRKKPEQPGRSAGRTGFLEQDTSKKPSDTFFGQPARRGRLPTSRSYSLFEIKSPSIFLGKEHFLDYVNAPDTRNVPNSSVTTAFNRVMDGGLPRRTLSERLIDDQAIGFTVGLQRIYSYPGLLVRGRKNVGLGRYQTADETMGETSNLEFAVEAGSLIATFNYLNSGLVERPKALKPVEIVLAGIVRLLD